jgi:hypothetical protein
MPEIYDKCHKSFANAPWEERARFPIFRETMKPSFQLPTNLPSLALAAIAFLSVAGPRSISAAPFYLQADMDGSASLNNIALYNSQPNGSGTAPSAMAGNSFFTNGYSIRFQNGPGTSGSFAGDLLTLDASGNLKAVGGYTVENLAIVAGVGSYAGKLGFLANTGASTSSLTVGNLNIAAGALLALTSLNAANATLSLAVETLSGSGNFSIGGETLSGGSTYKSITGNTVKLSITDAEAYTGTILWGSAITENVFLDFDSAFSSLGGLVARSNDRINLDQNLTFGSVTLNGITLTNGTYSYAELSENATYGSLFSGGSGSITVVPEPTTAGLAAAGLAVIFTLGRRKTARQA